MKWFKNLHMKKKMLVIFSLMCSISLIIGWVGYSGLNSLMEIQSEFQEVELPGITAVLGINEAQVSILVGERGLINPNMMKKEIRSAQYAWLESAFQRVKKNIEIYNAVPKADKINLQWTKFNQSWENWKNSYSNLIEVSREKDEQYKLENKDLEKLSKLDEKAYEISLIDRKYFLECQDVLTQLVELHRNQVNEKTEYAEATVSSSNYILAIVLILAIIISVIIGSLFTKIVAGPLQKLTNIADCLAIGDVEVEICSETEDEIGNLEKAFSQMIENTKYQAESAMMIAEGNMNVQITAKSEKDVLSKSLEQVYESINNLISEANQIAFAASEGNLSKRGNTEKLGGAYKTILDNFNSILDSIIEPVQHSGKILEVIAGGDLTQRMEGSYKGDYSIIKNSINLLAESMGKALSDIQNAVEATASASNQISSSTEELAAGTQEQSQQTAEIAGAVEEMAKTVIENANNANSAASNSKMASETARKGSEKVTATKQGMKRIVESTNSTGEKISILTSKTNEIGEITQVIDEIADQTNLLALNAAIEAARAGEQGRGFAVVADEVRKLAERTTKATKEIAETIKSIQLEAVEAEKSMAEAEKAVEDGMALTEDVALALDQILKVSQQVNDMIFLVATGSEQQSSAAEQISRNIESISSVIQQSASGTQQIAEAAEDMNKLTMNIQRLVSKFKIEGTFAPEHLIDRKGDRKMLTF